MENDKDAIVKINGHEYETFVVDGVRRFSGHGQVPLLILELMQDFDAWLENGQKGPKPAYSLDELVDDYRHGRFTLDELVAYYTHIEFSVDAMHTIPVFEDLTFELEESESRD